MRGYGQKRGAQVHPHLFFGHIFGLMSFRLYEFFGFLNDSAFQIHPFENFAFRSRIIYC